MIREVLERPAKIWMLTAGVFGLIKTSTGRIPLKLNSAPDRIREPAGSKEMLDAGELAVRKGDSISLREAVKHLWKLWPQDEKAADEERANRLVCANTDTYGIHHAPPRLTCWIPSRRSPAVRKALHPTSQSRCIYLKRRPIPI